jgi:hypothetical protein
MNNLKQHGLALHSYHDANNRFPQGNSLYNGAAAPGEDSWTWIAFILPYVEQDNLWRQAKAFEAGGGTNWYSWYNPACAVKLKVFTCPADPRGSQVFPGASFGIQDQALTTYLGNSGTTSSAFDGVLFQRPNVNVSVTMTGIQDGTSNTLLVGERPPNSNLEFGWTFAAYGYDGRGNGDCVMTSNDLAMANYFITNYGCPSGVTAIQKIGLKPGQPNVGCDAAHYWSFHPSSSLFLLCDGSARVISYNNDNIIAALSTRVGGEVITLN